MDETSEDLNHLRIGSGKKNCHFIKSLVSENNVCTITDTRPALLVKVKVNSHNLIMEIDAGASVRVISSSVYENYFSQVELVKTDKKFFTADGNECHTLGIITVLVNNENQLQALVIKEKKSGHPLLGRTWLDVLCPNWRNYFKSCLNNDQIYHISNGNSPSSFTQKVISEFKSVFEPQISPIKNFKVHLSLKEGSRPKFIKAATVPFAVKDEVERQIRELESSGVLKYIPYSNWASQVVVVPKKKG